MTLRKYIKRYISNPKMQQGLIDEIEYAGMLNLDSKPDFRGVVMMAQHMGCSVRWAVVTGTFPFEGSILGCDNWARMAGSAYPSEAKNFQLRIPPMVGFRPTAELEFSEINPISILN